MKISKLTVGKGRSQESAEGKIWERLYYEVEISIDDQTEVEVARSNALGLIDGWLSQPVSAAKPTAPLDIFPKELADLLSFEENKDWIIVKPRLFLGSENFAKIAAIVREHSGEYISQGRQSHFRLPKTAAK